MNENIIAKQKEKIKLNSYYLVCQIG